tara:strand:- start:778 stop:966 length:189 start_codon:yes stop_codon:yes gene_type:complete
MNFSIGKIEIQQQVYFSTQWGGKMMGKTTHSGGKTHFPVGELNSQGKRPPKGPAWGKFLKSY